MCIRDRAETASEIVIGVGISALISAVTVAGKALGKTVALKNDVKIVELVGGVFSVFTREK